jgi:uroporphyrin-III C-methyltransferase/precorrin-2 dehydrogenase/sirohydrochlorin ferrochelatase
MSRPQKTGTGFVSLVGAGPGDPELMTQKGLIRLREADLVLYDALVSPELLQLAPHAQRFSVGKRARRKGVQQETIHHLMIRAAQRGKRVVRLKCGDPFVLGRGGEEALALRAAGIPFEVVPGVTTATAAPALSGIPVTHRSMASGFIVFSGHAEEAFGPMLAAIAPGSMTVVVLMGLAKRAEIAQRMIERGWSAATPAAIVLGASTRESESWLGTLGGVGTAPVDDSDLPGTIVIGAVASLSSVLGSTGAVETEAIGGDRVRARKGGFDGSSR